eukprot:SAG31_NODE_9_length_42330_cov_441.979162_2_plen_374_part_00
MKMKTAITTALYKKSLKLSARGKAKSSTGEMINLMANDTERLLFAAVSFNMAFSTPILIIGALVQLINEIGASALGGVAVMLVVLMTNGPIMGKIKGLETQKMRLGDERVKIMTELIQGIKIVKLYTWETAFTRSVTAKREEEIETLKSRTVLQIAMTSIMGAAPLLIMVITFLIYAWAGNELTATKVFTCMALFQILQFPMMFIPFVLMMVMMVKVSLTRFHKFLSADEIKLQLNEVIPQLASDDAVRITNCDFAWGFKPTGKSAGAQGKGIGEAGSKGKGGRSGGGKGSPAAAGKGAKKGKGKGRRAMVAMMSRCMDGEVEDDMTATVSNIELTVKKGTLCCIYGPIGSGKSSLIQGLLSELVVSRRCLRY